MLILRIVPRWANSCLKDCVYIIESNEFFSSHQAITTTTALLWWLINFWNPTPWTHSPHLSHCISVVFAGFTICKSEFTSDLPFEHWWTLWMANQLEIQSEGCPSIWVTESIVTSAQIIQLPEVYSAVDLSFQCAIRSHSSGTLINLIVYVSFIPISVAFTHGTSLIVSDFRSGIPSSN